MRRDLGEIDLHITWLLLVFALGMPCVGCARRRAGLGQWPVWCCLAAVVLIPQGRIYFRAFVDYPRMNQPKGSYLLVNECQVVLCAGLIAGLDILLAWLLPPKS